MIRRSVLAAGPDVEEDIEVAVAAHGNKAKGKRPPASNIGTPVSDVMRWRHYIGLDGPLDKTTRYVLLVIGSFMHVHTGQCYPSFKRIAEYALLTERAVAKHVRKAIEEGFLIRYRRRGSNYYQAAFPTHDRHPPPMSIAERIELLGPHAGEPGERARQKINRLRQRQCRSGG
jgi:hypothetical protein